MYILGDNTLKQLTLIFFISIIITVCGCQPQGGTNTSVTPKQLAIGYIDADELLVKWNKYREFGDKYIAERNKLVETISEKQKKGSSKEDIDKARASVAEFDSKWDLEREVIVAEIREASAKVAKEQKIDVVLDNSSSNAVIEYGGTNLTINVLEKLKQQDSKNK